jgi:hypothetical protein
MTRYAHLRKSIAYFAASPEDQLAHDMGADDAVNELPYPLQDMLEHGEITKAAIRNIRPLEELIEQYCASQGAKPWHDEGALFSDPLWQRIRSVAASLLEKLPND